jgi:NADH-quinone oxidoreductase subunit N
MALGFAGSEGSANLSHIARGWVPVIALAAVLSMLLGNLVAIRQTSLRRLLAYSAIAHAGYMLLGIVAHTQQSLAALLYYVITYALATLGAFAVIAVVEDQRGSDQLAHFDGLGGQAPVLSGCLAIFILSLAGIPPLAGFFGKFYLFATVLASTPRPVDLLWLVALAIAMSIVSLYYYLRVLKRVYVTPPSVDAPPIQSPALSQFLVVLLAAAVLLFGCAPQLLLQWIQAAVQSSGL